MDTPGVPQTTDRMKQWALIGLVAVVLAGAALYLLMSGKVKKFGNVVPPPATPSIEEEHARVLEEIPILNLFGTITKIEENMVTIDVSEILGVEIPKNSPRRTRTVVISSETNIFDRFSKSDAELQKEIELYRKKGNQNAPPPTPYELKEISADDLKVGDGIIIEGESGLDLKDLASIPALKIMRANFF